MKKLSVILFIWCLPIFLMAQWVTDNNYGFKINVPSNWSKETAMDGADKTHSFSDPTENVYIQVRAFKADGISADDISQVFESQYIPTANRVAFEAYTLNNTPGKFAGYTMHINGLDVGIGAFYAVKNGYGYVVWSMIETKHYNQYSGQGDAVLNTFTTFAAASKAKAIVIPPVFKITNMKVGKKLTTDYNITPQDEATVFDSEHPKIFVIWDWEGTAGGKIMKIRWFRDNKEIKVAENTYTLPNEKQGYGWANIVKPSGGFVAGNYHVQIDFEGKKQRSMNFKVNKKASAQNANFVIKPPSGAKKNTNTTNISSGFKILINEVKIGSTMKPGSKEVATPSKVFYPNTVEVVISFPWQGNGNGEKLTVNWHYYKPGTSDKMTITTGDYHFPNQEGGLSNFILTKPNNGWPLGQYWIEFYLDDKFYFEWRFDVKSGSAQNTKNTSTKGGTQWGKATGSAASSSGSSSSAKSFSGKAKTVVLTSGGSTSCFSFKNGKAHQDHKSADIIVEPWCTKDAGVCGNWLNTNETNFDAITSPPSSGYISDLAGYTDCQIMPSRNVAVVKLKDGTYAKMMILKTEFSKNTDGCTHKTTIKYVYPL